MKIIVTGAAGAIGSHLAERFAGRGDEVIGIDAFTPYYSPQIKRINAADIEASGARLVEADLAADDLDDVLDGAEMVFHLAAQPGISAATPLDDYIRNNIVATGRLIEAARRLPSLRLFVNASTSSVYGARANGDESSEPKPTSHYGVTKLAAEQLVMAASRDWGFPAMALRFFSVFGERERPEKFFHKFIRAMYEDAEVPLYEGSEKHIRSFTYVQDIIDGCIAVADNPAKAKGQIINLGNDKTATTGDGIRIIEEIMGKKAKLKIMPKRSGDQLETAADIRKARDILGYDPKIGLETGLRAEIEWYGNKLHGKIS